MKGIGKLVKIGGPLIKFLQYLAKFQLTLPRGKKKAKEGQENLERQQTLSPWVGFSLPKRQHHLFEFSRCDAEILRLQLPSVQ